MGGHLVFSISASHASSIEERVYVGASAVLKWSGSGLGRLLCGLGTITYLPIVSFLSASLLLSSLFLLSCLCPALYTVSNLLYICLLVKR